MSPNLPELIVQNCIETKTEVNEYNNNSSALTDRNIQQRDDISISRKENDELIYNRKVIIDQIFKLNLNTNILWFKDRLDVCGCLYLSPHCSFLRTVFSFLFSQGIHKLVW